MKNINEDEPEVYKDYLNIVGTSYKYVDGILKDFHQK